MNDARIVTFGIPLVASWVASDWSRVIHQLEATLGSIYAQTDPNFRVIVAGTDTPALSTPVDDRFEFIACEQLRPLSRDAQVTDGVRKRHRVAQRLRELGGGYLMLTDADDLISSRLVAFVRRDHDSNGYVVSDGYMFDAGRGMISAFPFPNSPSEMPFHQECGTSAIPFFAPDDLPASETDPDSYYDRLMADGHPQVVTHSTVAGRPLKDLPFRAVCYVRNTGENLSAQFEGNADRIPFQAYLDDQLEANRLAITAELDAEFNLAASESAAKRPPVTRHHQTALGLSVLVSTYRRPQGLRRLLTALRPQVENRADREIIVVNDGSHDDAYAAVASEFADIVRYVPLAHNQGIAMARNASLAACWGTYAVFTDDDCVPPAWWLDWLSARLRRHPEVDVAVGTTTPHWVRENFSERLQGAWFIPRPWRIGRHDIFVTANVAIRAKLARAVGGFGFSEFDGAGEDTELSLRLHRAGARFLVDNSWTVQHDVNSTLRSLLAKYRRYGAANATISRLAAVEIPPPAGIGDRAKRLRGFPALLGAHRHMVKGFEGGPAARAAAAVTAAWIHSSYVAGFVSPRAKDRT